jgi:hypothetical protein
VVGRRPQGGQGRKQYIHFTKHPLCKNGCAAGDNA